MKKKTFLGIVILLVFGLICCDNENGKDEFTVTFNLNGGNISGNTTSVQIKVKSGETISSLPNPQNGTKTFGGWFANINGTGNQFDKTTTVKSNLTVYAKWISISIPPSLYWGIWENDEYKCRMDVSGIFFDEFGSNGGYVNYKVKNGSDWVNLAFGTLSIITQAGHGTAGDVIFIVTSKWIPENSSFSDAQSDLDTLLEYFNGSLTLNGTIDGSNIGSIIDFNEFIAFTKR